MFECVTHMAMKAIYSMDSGFWTHQHLTLAHEFGLALNSSYRTSAPLIHIAWNKSTAQTNNRIGKDLSQTIFGYTIAHLYAKHDANRSLSLFILIHFNVRTVENVPCLSSLSSFSNVKCTEDFASASAYTERWTNWASIETSQTLCCIKYIAFRYFVVAFTHSTHNLLDMCARLSVFFSVFRSKFINFVCIVKYLNQILTLEIIIL